MPEEHGEYGVAHEPSEQTEALELLETEAANVENFFLWFVDEHDGQITSALISFVLNNTSKED